MIRSQRHIAHGVLASVLAVGLVTVAGIDCAETAAAVAPDADALHGLLIARVDYTGKPPYNRFARDQQMEKSEFARFEEKAGDTKDKGKSSYDLKGKPPYNRNK